MILQDDPNFIPGNYPDLDFDHDYVMFESTQGTSSKFDSNVPSGASKQTGMTSQGSGKQTTGLLHPSGSEGLGGPGGLELRDSARPAEDEPSFFEDVGFRFDEEGNLIDLGEPAAPGTAPRLQSHIRGQGDSPPSQQLQGELQEAMTADEAQVSRKTYNTKQTYLNKLVTITRAHGS